MTNRRRLLGAAALAVAATVGLSLSGCAALNQFSAEVSSFGTWPAGRAPGSFAFDRLPSQQTQTELQQALEDAARSALQQAGFVAAAAGSAPDVLVQIGASVARGQRSPWDDPLWWHGGFGAWRHSPWRGPVWGAPLGSPWRLEARRYEREVALLLRDRASGQPLYEARASSEGLSASALTALAPLFRAAMADFPTNASAPHRVTVPLAP